MDFVMVATALLFSARNFSHNTGPCCSDNYPVLTRTSPQENLALPERDLANWYPSSHTWLGYCSGRSPSCPCYPENDQHPESGDMCFRLDLQKYTQEEVSNSDWLKLEIRHVQKRVADKCHYPLITFTVNLLNKSAL